MIFFSGEFAILATEIMSTGDETSTACDASKIVARARSLGARQMIMLHNHPIGSCAPSRQDVEQTEIVSIEAFRAGIYMMDHIICSRNHRFSIMQARLAAPIPVTRTAINQAQFSRLWVRMHYRLALLSRHDPRAKRISDKGWLILMTLYFETRPLWLFELSEMLALEPTIIARQIFAMKANSLINALPGMSESLLLVGLTAEGLDLVDDVFGTVLWGGEDKVNFTQFSTELRNSIKADQRSGSSQSLNAATDISAMEPH